MEALKLKRKSQRKSFTLISKTVEDELSKDDCHVENLQVILNQLCDKFERLDVTQESILGLLTDESDYENEFTAVETYRDNFLSLKVKIENRIEKLKLPISEEVNGSNVSLPDSIRRNRKFKLPKLELKKFSGDARDYLGFWSQYSKIHEDPDIVPEDKFQYLSQCVVPNSRAAQLINSFPLTAENYPKAVDQLKDRFGREDLLVQIYVRDLLCLVTKNAASGRSSPDLAELYDSLESKLRALESLGRTKEKFADFLGPLVESCLPENILRAWERSRISDEGSSKNSERTLENLMCFLRHEVESEEMIKLAHSGFGNSSIKRANKNLITDNLQVPTTAMLVSTDENCKGKQNFRCIFCDKPHLSSRCFKADKMSLTDRKRIVQEKGACFACLRIGHLKYQCKANIKCHICNNSHLKLMCPSRSMKDDEKPMENDSKTDVSLSNNSRNKGVYLQTLYVNIKIKGKKKKVRALLDSGSQHSYVGERVVKQMEANPIRCEKVIHGLFGGKETEPLSHSVFAIEMSDIDDTFKCFFEAFSEKKICGFVPNVNDPKILDQLRCRNIRISDSLCKEKEIDLLIGADIIGKLLTKEFVELTSGLTAVKTKLGWTVMGKQNEMSTKDNVLTVLSLHASNIALKDLWELEILGVSDPIQDVSRMNASFQNAVDFESKLTRLSDGRYELELPWKYDSPNLPDNKNLALVRHEKMMRRAKDNDYLKKYQEVFREWETLNIIERVPENELSNKCHFLAHRPVFKASSETTKIRPVFDASANERGKPSLNDCLTKGPNLIELIPNILDRFRSYPIGLSADIEKAFLQLGIAPKDRDYLRFFYPCDEGELVYRHCRVVFGVSCSPYLLNASINHLLDNSPLEFNDVVQKLRYSFYMDNCLTGVFDKNDELNFIQKAETIMSKGCFNLRGWESNVACKYTSKHSGDTSLLGMLWNLNEDTLRCNINLNVLTCDIKITKRTILSIVQTIFDPIGLLAPTTLLPKLMLQKTWTLKISWDEVLPPDIENEFYKWISDVPLLTNFAIPRYIGDNATAELHVFVDACKNAYAACVFVRSVDSSQVNVRLLRAKARVAPLKSLSIPRLELMACCIGTRLASSICKALDLPEQRVTFWSDSTVVLWWIRNHGEWSNFVANRVKEIRQLTQVQSWRHVPGNMNPADVLSRGCFPKQMLRSGWWNGPPWLKNSPEVWPVSEIFAQPVEVDLERRKIKITNVNLAEDSLPWYAKRVSNYDKMIRVIGWVLRFLNNCRRNSSSCKDSELSFSEIVSSEKALIRFVQSSNFPDTKVMDSVDKFRDNENILRVKTRIVERKDKPSFLSPILLPGNCAFTRLLIESVHQKNCHAGVQMMQSILRERFWILKQRKTIRSVLYKCVKCRRYKAEPMLCEPSPLPADRVEDTAAFEIVGVDLAGPLFLKGGEKVWLALFTCAVYRAVHLELVNSLSADSFLLALRRFIARRGRPKTIYSDNGTNFKGAFNELSNLDWEMILKKTKTQRIFWKFNPPTAAWWGGWWERLVRVIKELLRRTLGKSVLSCEELETLLCDCESVINSRPLTYVSENSQDLIPLTPSMFLTENRCSDVTDLDLVESQHYQKRIRYRAKLFKDLRNRFRREYLSQLVMKHTQNKSVREPSVGEIVLIGDDVKRRMYWPLAKVMETIPGRDGRIRTVKLKTQSGTFLRPVQRIFPLEIPFVEPRSEVVVQKEGLMDQSKTNNKDKATEEDQTRFNSGIINQKFSSFGRPIKVPKRLDLFNQITYVFESLSTDSKRGEDVAETS